MSPRWSAPLLLGVMLNAIAARSGETPVPAPALAPASTALAPETLNIGRFGEITLYRPSGQPREVVLFLSGDGGWELGVLDMAKVLAQRGALVAGIDVRHYMAELEDSTDKCVSTSDDLSDLSRSVQTAAGLSKYLEPTLVGYSSGATLVYATIVAAPDNLFKGALSLGFCPDLDLKKPICPGAGLKFKRRKNAKGVLTGVDFLPARKLGGRWVSLQGAHDEVCPYLPTQRFMAKVPGADMVLLPKVGHGYSVPKNWTHEYEAAFDRIVARQP